MAIYSAVYGTARYGMSYYGITFDGVLYNMKPQIVSAETENPKLVMRRQI